VRRFLIFTTIAACTADPARPPPTPPIPATGDLWTCRCACDDRTGGPRFVAPVVGCVPIGLDDTVTADRTTACGDVCSPSATIGLHDLAYIGPCRAAELAPDGFADGHLTGPSSCDPAAHPIATLTDVASYHATVDPTRSTMTLDAGDHIDASLAGRIAFDFDVPLSLTSPYWIFFENLQLESQGDVQVRVFEANDVYGGIDANAMAFRSSGVLPVRWRDAYGPHGINPQSATGWHGQLDLAARTMVIDLSGADPSDESYTFVMHVEAVVDDLPPVADAGGDPTLPCTSPSGTPVVLDASASRDPDPGDAITHIQWFQLGPIPISHDTSTTVNLGVGTSYFEVHVYDRALGAGYLMKKVTITSSASCP